jgi:hypothetical protein
MKFVEIHSIDSNKNIIINTRFIAEIEHAPHGTNIWLATDAGTMRMIRTSLSFELWYRILEAT